MDKKKQELNKNQELLSNEFQKYKDKISNYKPYMKSMEDISAWIEERGR